jgi:hypothetical protein
MQPLNLAIIKDHLEIAKKLLAAGAKVDGGDTPALFTACALEKTSASRNAALLCATSPLAHRHG